MRHRPRPFWTALLLAAGCAAQQGCSRGAASHEDRPEVTRAEADAVRAGDLYRPAPRTVTLRASDLGAERELPDRLRVVEAAEDGGWYERTYDANGELIREVRLRRAADGSVELVNLRTIAPGRAGELGELAEYRFNPPLLVMPDELRPGVVAEGESGLLVIDGGEREGTAESRVELLGPEEIAYDGTRVDAERVKLVITLRSGPATVERSRLAWLNDDELIRERDRLNVRVFGFEVRSEDVLLSPRPGGGRSFDTGAEASAGD